MVTFWMLSKRVFYIHKHLLLITHPLGIVNVSSDKLTNVQFVEQNIKVFF